MLTDSSATGCKVLASCQLLTPFEARQGSMMRSRSGHTVCLFRADKQRSMSHHNRESGVKTPQVRFQLPNALLQRRGVVRRALSGGRA